MTFFRKLFGGRGGDAYSEGVVLFEQGEPAAAIPLLRPTFEQEPGSPRGSLAGLYLRQSLVAEGRRALHAGDLESAARHLNEAAGKWPEFPDLQFLSGAASGFAGDWGAGLESARQALRRNPDYCEARLLEACALQALGRREETVASLDKLVESGRRVNHVLNRTLADAAPFAVDSLPSDLLERLRSNALGGDVKNGMTEAVALCSAGRWADGLELFRTLTERHPRYPDIHAKYAAALYQTGDVEAALAEADAALAINERYRTAVSLKGLILAEQGDVLAAQEFLADAVPRLEGTAGRHEELFLAYLRAVLALLLDDLDACRGFLENWHDLPRQFARAELLLVACDDLSGWTDAARRRLEDLCTIWHADPELLFFRVALMLRHNQWSAAEALLGHWPQAAAGEQDARPLLLRARLDVARDCVPTLIEPTPTVEQDADPEAASWMQLAAHACLLGGDAAGAVALARALLDADLADEETGRLLVRAAGQAGMPLPEDLAVRVGIPDSWVPEICCKLRHEGHGVEAESLVTRHGSVRPDDLRWSWLSTDFWLAPVRRWLA